MVNATVFEFLCIALKLPLCRFTGVYKDAWVPFRTLLQQICHYSKADLIQYLIGKYDAFFVNENDFHEVLFLENDAILCQSEHQQKSNTYKVVMEYEMSTIDEISRNTSCNLNKEMKSYLAACSKYSEKKFITKLSAFQSWFLESVRENICCNVNQLRQLCSISTKLYLMKLQNILKNFAVFESQFSQIIVFDLCGSYSK